MCKSSKQIEEDAIDFLKLALKKSKHIHREISEGDREPLWDGHIYFYKNKVKQNTDLIARIPVQVKGKDDCYNKNKGYPIKRQNLEHYLNEGGILYFVVYLKDKIPTVTYASLTPKVIKKILLASNKKKQSSKTISITTRPLPENEDELNLVFLNFIQKRKHQKGFTHLELRSHESIFESSENPDGDFQFNFIGKEYLDILEYARSGELDLYYKPKGATIAEPLLDDISDLRLFEEKEIQVQIQGMNKIYNTIFIYKSKNDYTIDFQNGCSLKIHENHDNGSLTLNYSYSDVLSKRLDGLQFILELQKNKGIILNGHKLDFSDENLAKINFKDFKIALDKHIHLKKIIDKLNITTEIDFKNWSKQDSRIVELLYDSIINEQLVTLNRTDYYTIQVINFANIHVLLLLIPDDIDSKNYKLYSFSEYNLILTNENKQQCSKYEAIDLEQLLLIDNFDVSDYLSSYFSIDTPIENKELGLLKLINYYDRQCDKDILKFCLEFAQKLVNTDKSEYNLLNLLQVKKRLNTLTTEDINYLLSLTNHNSVEIRFAAFSILGYTEQANYLFKNEFSVVQRETFIEYPIYSLIKP